MSAIIVIGLLVLFFYPFFSDKPSRTIRRNGPIVSRARYVEPQKDYAHCGNCHGSPFLSDCEYCNGSGFVYVNPNAKRYTWDEFCKLVDEKKISNRSE